MTPTHEQVLAAIDKVRQREESREYYYEGALVDIVVAHCYDLRATAERHAPFGDWCDHCSQSTVGGRDEPWPCPDYQQVIDRLTGWGVL